VQGGQRVSVSPDEPRLVGQVAEHLLRVQQRLRARTLCHDQWCQPGQAEVIDGVGPAVLVHPV
jgi:hypothetical protein